LIGPPCPGQAASPGRTGGTAPLGRADRRGRLSHILRRLLTPYMSIGAVWELDPQRLKEQGIRGLIVDLDNTLVDWDGRRVRPEVVAWARGVRGLGLKLCITTNAHRKERVSAIAGELDAFWVAPARKPFSRAYSKPMAIMRTGRHDTAVVGDQIFTDVLGGNMMGLRTFLVRPLSRHDFPATKISRVMERIVRPFLGLEGKPRC